MSEVKIGQLYADNDKREAGRTLRVIRLVNDVNGNPYYACCIVGATSKHTRIRVDRLSSRAFTLIRDVDGKRISQPEPPDGE